MRELALADSIPVHDDPVGLVAPGALVEHHQVLLNLEKTHLHFQLLPSHGIKILTIADRS